MLGSITPLGERGRRMRWGLTVAFYVAGSVAAGAGLGALLGWGGAGVMRPGSVPFAARLWALAAMAALALALDVRAQGAHILGPRRQVNEDWLTRYRGWVYGSAFGFQLGLGVVTIVTTSLVYLTLAAEVVSGSARSGFLIGGTFGLVRALPAIGVARIRRTSQVAAVGARLRRWEDPARALTLAAEVALLAALTAALVWG